MTPQSPVSPSRVLITESREAAEREDPRTASELAWQASLEVLKDYIQTNGRSFLARESMTRVAQHAAETAGDPRIATWYAASHLLRENIAEQELDSHFLNHYINQVSLLIGAVEPLTFSADLNQAIRAEHAVFRARDQLQSGDTTEPFRTGAQVVDEILDFFASIHEWPHSNDDDRRHVVQQLAEDHNLPEVLARYDTVISDSYFVHTQGPHITRARTYVEDLSSLIDILTSLIPR